MRSQKPSQKNSQKISQRNAQKNHQTSSLSHSLIHSLIQSSVAALLSVSVLAACGAHYGTRGGSGVDDGPGSQNTTVGTLPEAHGSMDFHDATIQEAAQPAGTSMTGVNNLPNTDAATNRNSDATGAGGNSGAMPARKNLCIDKYDATKALPPDLVCARCERGEFSQPGLARKKLDILFVADSSPSLSDTRDQIAKSVSKFVAALPDNTDYRFAVLPAHSDKSYDNVKKPSSGLGGKLYANPGEPVVLKGSDFRSTSALTAVLERKLTKMPIDKPSDGGELGIYSLNLAIQEPLLSKNRLQGFFREDAALAVIFISDENDICSRDVNYPAGVKPNNLDPDRYTGTYNNVKPEDWGLQTDAEVKNPEIVANRFYCKDAQGHPTVTDETVYTKLREMMAIKGSATKEARPLLISGVLYTDPSTVPTTPPAGEPFPQYFVEKEVGYGYVDMIKLNGGQAADIGKANYDEGLSAIGKQAAVKLQVKTQFQLKDGVSVDPNSICVVVNGREATGVDALEAGHPGFTYTYSAPTREVLLQGVGATDDKGSASKVDIFYCEPPSVTGANPEKYSHFDLPTIAEHYRNLPVPSACRALKSKIQSGVLNNG